jgi:hypothetical protein
MTTGINYAKAFGIESVPAAIVFTFLYIPLFGWFARQSLRRPTYVHFVLTFFCTLRIVTFAMRAALAGSESAGENVNLLIADEIISGVGYFGLLYSAYILVLDLELISGRPPSANPILALIRNRHAFRMALSVGVAVGIAGSSIDNGLSSTARTLHKASLIIFLVLTCLQAFQTAILAKQDMTVGRQYKQDNETFGRKHGIIILLFIALLLLIREGFSASTLPDPARLNNEHFWYPFIAVPEILAVVLYATPDLVPARDEVAAPNTYPLDNRA